MRAGTAPTGPGSPEDGGGVPIMSIPTFDASELVTKAARDVPGGIAPRHHAETMPGLDGRFVQPHGTAGRQIAVNGALQATGETPAAAHQALKVALRAKQALVDGQTVADYVGTDGHTYSNCILLSYEPRGQTIVSSAGPPYTATVFVVAGVAQLVT